jgi:hypothetical protein
VYRREIRTMSDIRGLEMCIAGLGGNIWAVEGVDLLELPEGGAEGVGADFFFQAPPAEEPAPQR